MCQCNDEIAFLLFSQFLGHPFAVFLRVLAFVVALIFLAHNGNPIWPCDAENSHSEVAFSCVDDVRDAVTKDFAVIDSGDVTQEPGEIACFC